jgi:hypothetical protein
MRLNNYAILPAAVRYDKNLSHGAKLLYAEITAASDFTGSCEDDIKYFGKVLDVDSRTVRRWRDQLCDASHIKREGGKLRTPQGFESLSTKKETPLHTPEDIEYFQAFIKRFEEGMKTTIQKPEGFYNVIADRLGYYSKHQLMSALENRIAFIQGSEWHQLAENRHNATDITLLIRDNDHVLKWLNTQAKKDSVEVKAFKFT